MPDMTPDELARAGLRVKPLEWEDFGTSDHRHEARFLYMGFEITCEKDGWYFSERNDDEWQGPIDTLEAAQAAAQADYDARILAALTPAPVAPDVAGLIKRLERWADGSGIANHFIGDRSAAQDCADAAAALRAMPADPVAEAARGASGVDLVRVLCFCLDRGFVYFDRDMKLQFAQETRHD